MLDPMKTMTKLARKIWCQVINIDSDVDESRDRHLIIFEFSAGLSGLAEQKPDYA